MVFLTFAVAFGVLVALLLVLKGSAMAGAELAVEEANCPDLSVEPVPAGCEQSEFELAEKPHKVVGRLIQCTEHHCIVQQQGRVLVLRVDDIKEMSIPIDGKVAGYARPVIRQSVAQ